MKPKITKIGHVGLTVRDIDRTIAFYSTYLGMRLTEKFEYEEVRLGHGVAVQAGAFIRCDTTHHELSIFKMRSEILPDSAPDAARFGYGLHHIACLANRALIGARYSALSLAQATTSLCGTGKRMTTMTDIRDLLRFRAGGMPGCWPRLCSADAG